MKAKMVFLAMLFLAWQICPDYVFSQSFTRVLEVRSARMNGPDVSSLQVRLLSLGFSQVGEADGYYGPMTENAVKNIQRFAGFEENGKVDRILWDFIFANDEFARSYLRLINTASQYNKNELYKIQDSQSYEYWNNFGFEYAIYFASDGKMRILEIRGGNGDNFYSKDYYFADTDRYIVISSYANANNPNRSSSTYLRMEGFSNNIRLGKPDYEPSHEHDDSELPSILFGLRFR
jgi:peptidoglycan hydrolase-like protein with peptidoglycan-binding domain